MITANIKYSEITKEKMELYYINNFIAPAEIPGYKREHVARLIYAIISSLLFLVGGGYAFLLFAQWVLIEGYWEGISEKLSAILLALCVLSIVLRLFNVLAEKLGRKLFPVASRVSRENDIRQDIGIYFEKFWEFQELLQRGSVDKLSLVEGCKLVAEYTGVNGVTCANTLNLDGHFGDTVKSDCLDFSWLDEKLEEILRDNKYPSFKKED